ncbi:bifunctional 4-hydroxy-2-oxoglutarate aldolase/2-dehydro-3-deoxy-phosphogluconate aldolase [Methylobacter sp. Wu8]|jgi:2-dehydro-3-deoxyphosphogluconate aldolase/(4S)-4-hydroxy-2-oxoglutarate aldolase|uniref:2-dehydro-3-deoxy-phosphogluconate aldolase n=1 Tax=Methylobacter tundripaludum TaxID=173365 RepID=A0A2S6H821_9GAMM|nr:bifunctional 4-hydroxy-2-oxoglutarate aldolase/2-dehydro-3-deoxy-phosphogluconate aldolase [Methylobacter tundripaludum]MCF7966793.1 bifunctional 4-hydroxy-2-oxoglutarate aldolase/2-dehydro-3-deoxy-phosphogluconate aldolase [Methylobacter tundripaludum]MCK9636319.1 bifunctional 4-hydroxy-2-oxoglutarate aldolase/2-dehydro-3-deoxy-phosphogluconate aldolase [Methylobacter tundripaludum]PPK73546.1 2-dehydro-3-deoxyphosphogluconate aldolase/(4S)-4-hydroxy-2-oxoglutarate aldolase [Methylobacter tun
MTKNNWKIQPAEVLNAGPVMPVMVIQNLEDAVPLAQALVAGGIKVLEITLRTPIALDAIRLISREVKDAIVGAGTITTPEQLRAAEEAGAVFAISPGLTPKLLAAANDGNIALIPGIATLSELMLGMEYGLDHFKFFPAEAAGGIPMLKSIAGPVPKVTFCPTGGISPENYNSYLQLSNVACVGGSWLVPADVVKSKNWARVTELAKQTIDKVVSV